jgi:hypothetical protein
MHESVLEPLITESDVTTQSTWHGLMDAAMAVCDRHGLRDEDLQMLELLTTIGSTQVDIPFSEERTA